MVTEEFQEPAQLISLYCKLTAWLVVLFPMQQNFHQMIKLNRDGYHEPFTLRLQHNFTKLWLMSNFKNIVQISFDNYYEQVKLVTSNYLIL